MHFSAFCSLCIETALLAGHVVFGVQAGAQLFSEKLVSIYWSPSDFLGMRWILYSLSFGFFFLVMRDTFWPVRSMT